MKKSLLLIALPALLVLSSCNAVKGNAKQNNFDYFKEDTLAHEEFFSANGLTPKKLGQPEEDPESGVGQFTLTPKIGVQFQNYEKDVDSDPAVEDLQTFYVVRYVAAVSLTSLDGVTAEWKRAVSDDKGTQIKDWQDGFMSTELYPTLNNGSTPVNATSESGGEYKNYLVYSMYGIPASHINSYIAAYLTLSKAGETDVVSKAVAAKIDGDNAFSFTSDKNGYFLAGKLDGQPNSVADADTDKKGDSNKASFTMYLSDGDEFVAAQKTVDDFKVWSGSRVRDGDDKFNSDSEMITISNSRRYVIYLNGDGEFYHTAYGNTGTDVYLRGPAAKSGGEGWGAAAAAARFYDDPDNDGFLRYTFSDDDINKSFKLAHQNDWYWSGIGYDDTLHGDAKDGVHLTNDGGNIKVLIKGTYDFYVKSGEAWVYFVR